MRNKTGSDVFIAASTMAGEPKIGKFSAVPEPVAAQASLPSMSGARFAVYPAPLALRA